MRKGIYVAVVYYRSPNQNSNEFDNFLKNIETRLNQTCSNNPLLTVIFGDFNARSSVLWIGDKTKRRKPTRISYSISFYGHQKLMISLPFSISFLHRFDR